MKVIFSKFQKPFPLHFPQLCRQRRPVHTQIVGELLAIEWDIKSLALIFYRLIGTWRNTGPLYSLSLKAICALRFSVMYIPERIASNLRAFSAGIMPSKLLSTHTHFACIGTSLYWI